MDMSDQPIIIHEFSGADWQDADRQRWDNFVHAHADGSFFHLSGWYRVLRDGLGHKPWYLMATQGGQIVGVLPLAEVKSFLFGHHLSALPFCVYGGPLASNEAVESQLLLAAKMLAKQQAVDDLEIRVRKPLPPGSEGEWLQKDLYFTFRRALSEDSETNLKAIPRKQRAMVRKAIAADLQFTIDTDWQDFLYCYDTSVRNLGTPAFPRSYFKVLKEVFADYIDILTVRSGKQPISSVLSFYYKDEVLPYYGGGNERARVLAANDYMYWQLMEHARQKGMRVFDFGRSKEGTGAYAFKKNWGFEPQALPYQYHLVRAQAMPEINPNNPKYALLISVWKKLPLSVSRVLGPFISRYVG